MKCESCGCPYVTNVPYGDIRFDHWHDIEFKQAQARIKELEALVREMEKFIYDMAEKLWSYIPQIQ